jgi:hypothetical protein
MTALATTTTAPAMVPFDDLVRMADTLARSRVIPQAYRGRTEDVVAAGLAGQAFGWDVMTSLRNYHVIEGTATLRPEAMLGLVRRAGHSVSIELTGGDVSRTAVVTGRRADNGDTHEARFSWSDANLAGLSGKKNWKQYPDSMLTWRAVSSLCRVLFPDVVLGAGYVPEEIGATVDHTGNVVEPDPFAEPDRTITTAQAKHLVLDYFDGDKDVARAWWDTNVGVDDVDLDRVVLEQRLSGEVVDAEVVDDPEDRLVTPVRGEDHATGTTDQDEHDDRYVDVQDVDLQTSGA